MPTFDQWKEIEQLARAVNGQKPRILHIDRPIYLHDRAAVDNEEMCRCGCESYDALRVETRPHIQVLIDRVTGKRRVRKPYNAEAFDRLAAKAERVLMPMRCYIDQLAPILDRKHKIIGVFGGNRSGKSETGKEALGDRWAEHGGKGAKFWWVAPAQEKTSVAVEKLVTGQTTNRFCRPLFPRELVRYYPKNERAKPQKIVLIDGSQIPLKYAGRKGGNLKGDSAGFVVLDEGTEVPHEINWTILVNRLMETGGQLMVTTTPVAGHWLKELNDQGVPYHAMQPDMDTGERAVVELSCLNNPWIPKAEVERTIKSFGGPEDPKVQREVFGKWVAEGNALWRHWSPSAHMLEGIEVTPEAWDYVNVTSIAARGLFQQGARLDMLGGWDCNDFPQSLIVAYVCVRDQSEVDDPNKWSIVVMDEIVEPASIEKWAQLLLNVGPKRGRGVNWLNGLSIIGDATTCYADTRVNRQGQGADADVLRRAGFQVRGPTYRNGNPHNPSIRDRVNLLHRLMHERRLRIHGRCRKLLDAIEGQIADERGLPVKKSKQASDRLSGPADALGYLCYAVIHKALLTPKHGGQWGGIQLK